MRKINFSDKFNKFADTWSPKVIAEMNNYQFKLVKIKNDFEENNNIKKESFFRIINEIPTILFILIVLLVVFKPFD